MDATTATTLDPLRQYRSWASVFFAVLGAVGLVGLAVATQSTSAPFVLLFVVTAAVSVVILFAVSLAVGRGDAWAIHAVAPLCVLVILFGLIRVAIALGSGTITVPLEVLGAIAVISRDHRPELLPALDEGGRRRMWLAVGGLIVTYLLPYAGEPVMRGSFLTASADDLTLRVEVECAGATEPGTPLLASVRWSWAGGRPFAPPTDGVVVRWYATTEGADPAAGLTPLDHHVSDASRINAGTAGESDALLEGFRRSGLPVLDFVIARDGSELREGRIDLELVPSDRASPSGSVEVQAAYAHGDLWVKQSNLGVCSW
jgi:hypothetical protein